jgi:hypothetical protein
MYVFVGNCKNYAIMDVLKFTIKISENNTIQLPKNSTFIKESGYNFNT